MPIRIQQILPQGPAIGGAPYARATPEHFGAGVTREAGLLGGAVAQAGGRVMDEATAAQHTLLRVQAELQAEDAKLDMAQQAGELKTAYALRAEELKGQVDAKDLAATLSVELDRMVQESTAKLRYPRMAGRYRVALSPFVTEQKVGAMRDGIRLQHAQVEALAGIQQAEDANAAVFAATPEERAGALERGFERIQGLVNRGIYSGEQGKTATTGFLGQIERGGVRRDFARPELRAPVVEILMAGGLKYVPPAEQLAMATAFQGRLDAEQKQAAAAAEKDWKGAKDEALSDLMATAETGTLAPDVLEAARKTWRMTKDEYQDFRRAMERPAKETPSDPATLTRVIGDTYSIAPTMTERQLAALHAEGKLTTKDWQQALNRLRETREGLALRGEATAVRRHNQAEQELRALLGIPTLFDKLDAAKEKAWGLALQELRRRSSAFGGQEDALRVLEEIGPRYVGMLGADARGDSAKLAGMARVQGYETPEQVEQAFRAGKINRGTYENLRKLFLEIEAKRALTEQETAGARKTAPATTGGKPKRRTGAVEE